MISSYELLAALSVGFMGSLHCIGMCGGISAAITAALPADLHRQHSRLSLYQFTYNVGRLFSYALAGALVGWLGSLWQPDAPDSAPSILRILSGVMMILLGCYISGWWRVLTYLERLGSRLWQPLAPLTRPLIPADRLYKALGLGMLWGWLPCGLVYSALTWSLGTGTPLYGALTMLAFGVGTLPAMLSLGAFHSMMSSLSQSRLIRTLTALLLITFGLWTISLQTGLPFQLSGTHHH